MSIARTCRGYSHVHLGHWIKVKQLIREGCYVHMWTVARLKTGAPFLTSSKSPQWPSGEDWYVLRPSFSRFTGISKCYVFIKIRYHNKLSNYYINLGQFMFPRSNFKVFQKTIVQLSCFRKLTRPLILIFKKCFHMKFDKMDCKNQNHHLNLAVFTFWVYQLHLDPYTVGLKVERRSSKSQRGQLRRYAVILVTGQFFEATGFYHHFFEIQRRLF